MPSHDDRHLFEMLVLEGAQAGLSWSTILHKREGYRRAFAGFDVERGRRGSARATSSGCSPTPGIVRNRLKVESAIANARASLERGRAWSSCSGRSSAARRSSTAGGRSSELPGRDARVAGDVARS